jgi:hypothetical protein
MMKFDEMSDNKKMRAILHCAVPYFADISAKLALDGQIKEAWEATKFIGFISESIRGLDTVNFFKNCKEEPENV